MPPHARHRCSFCCLSLIGACNLYTIRFASSGAIDVDSDCVEDEIAFCVQGPQESEGLSEFMSQVVLAGEGVIQHRNAQVAVGKLERQPPLCIRWDGVNLTRALTPVVRQPLTSFPANVLRDFQRCATPLPPCGVPCCAPKLSGC